MQFISEYYSDKGDKTAKIYLEGGTYHVEFYYEGRKLKTVPMTGKALNYAEDAAENYTTGAGNFQFLNE